MEARNWTITFSKPGCADILNLRVCSPDRPTPEEAAREVLLAEYAEQLPVQVVHDSRSKNLDHVILLGVTIFSANEDCA